MSSSDDGTLILWDVADGEALRSFEGHTDWVETVDIAPDGIHVVSGSSDMTIKLWQIWMPDDELAQWMQANYEVAELTCIDRELYRTPEQCEDDDDDEHDDDDEDEHIDEVDGEAIVVDESS